MKPLTAKQVEKVLRIHGFILKRQKGSHKIYWHDEMKARVPVPFHGNKTLPIGTFMAIVKQSKLPRSAFH